MVNIFVQQIYFKLLIYNKFIVNININKYIYLRIENPRVDGSIPSQATKLKSPNQQWLGLFSWGHFLYLITELELARCGAVVLRQLLRYWFNDHPQATPYTGRPRRRPSNTDCLGAVTARSCVTPHESSSGPPGTFKSGASKLVKMGWCTGGSIGCCVAVVGVFAGGY